MSARVGPSTWSTSAPGRACRSGSPAASSTSTTPENVAFGEFIAGKLNACAGPVRFLLPEGGVSLLDAPGQAFWDPEADAALFATLVELVEQTDDRQVRRIGLP